MTTEDDAADEAKTLRALKWFAVPGAAVLWAFFGPSDGSQVNLFVVALAVAIVAWLLRGRRAE